jgi:AraC-like DNA-binding protein
MDAVMSQIPQRVKHRARTVRARVAITTEARRFIERHVGDRSLCVDDVADAVGVPVRTLQRALADCDTDYTREICNARMMRAVRLLAEEHRVATTAAWCGYASVSHFSKSFRECYGVSPSDFRLAAKLQSRLVWRRFNDKVRPVKAGSSEYFKRRKRYNEDVRRLRKLVTAMPSVARGALGSVQPPERRVYPTEWFPPDPPPLPRRSFSDAWFEALVDERQEEMREDLVDDIHRWLMAG